VSWVALLAAAVVAQTPANELPFYSMPGEFPASRANTATVVDAINAPGGTILDFDELPHALIIVRNPTAERSPVSNLDLGNAFAETIRRHTVLRPFVIDATSYDCNDVLCLLKNGRFDVAPSRDQLKLIVLISNRALTISPSDCAQADKKPAWISLASGQIARGVSIAVGAGAALAGTALLVAATQAEGGLRCLPAQEATDCGRYLRPISVVGLGLV